MLFWLPRNLYLYRSVASEVWTSGTSQPMVSNDPNIGFSFNKYDLWFVFYMYYYNNYEQSATSRIIFGINE